MAAAKSTHLCFLDDDDVYLPGALKAFHRWASRRPVFFRMDSVIDGVVWRDENLTVGNIGTPCLLIPNRKKDLGRWEPDSSGACGDFVFAVGCVVRMGDPVWRSEVVCKVRP